MAGLDELDAVKQQRSRLEAQKVESMVSSAFAVAREAMREPNRGPAETAFARQVAMYLSHTRLGLSYTAAGAAFGRDRTTAAHACRRVEDRREDPAIDAIVDFLERAIEVNPHFAAAEARP